MRSGQVDRPRRRSRSRSREGRDKSHRDERQNHRDRDRDQNRERDRDRNRDRDRERDRDRNRDGRDRDRDGRDNRCDERGEGRMDRGGYRGDYSNKDRERSGSFHSSSSAQPTTTIMIKSLPTHTTEPVLYAVLAPYMPKEIRLIAHRDGECRGFGFVEFETIEHAQYFMATFAGSTGDPTAPQLIIDNRAVLLDYAKGREAKPFPGGGGSSRDHYGDGGPGGDKSDSKGGGSRGDWLCESCTCHNFARRDVCFRCSAPRTANCVNVAQQNADPWNDEILKQNDSPSLYLYVRGFSLYVTEDQILEMFRQFAVVKNVQMLSDPSNNYSKGMAFVEFHSVEHALFALQSSTGMQMDQSTLRIGFAKEAAMTQLVSHVNNATVLSSAVAMHPAPAANAHSSAMHSSMISSALQAAQWSANNSYNSSSSSSNNSNSIASTIVQQRRPKSKWPPNFDTHGGAYVFQVKSGYFLEPSTEFFYCPKSKLYYSGQDGAYYQYVAEEDVSPDSVPFKRFLPPMPSEPEGTSAVMGQMVASSSASSGPMLPSIPPLPNQSQPIIKDKPKPISIGFSMKTGGGKSAKAGLGGGIVGGAGKSALKDIAKWAVLQDDDDTEDTEKPVVAGSIAIRKKVVPHLLLSRKDDGTSAFLSAGSGNSNIAAASNKPTPQPSQAPTQTAPAPAQWSGTSLLSEADLRVLESHRSKANEGSVGGANTNNSSSSSNANSVFADPLPPPPPASVAAPAAAPAPVCLLCRRQFPSMEVLHRHEKESKLHADNLLKQQQQQ